MAAERQRGVEYDKGQILAMKNGEKHRKAGKAPKRNKKIPLRGF